MSYLHAPPYNIEYFQIWNEPYGESDSFWPNGTWSAFFTYVHLPAAKVIHSYGAKVVFGGYPSAADSSIDDYINQLDTYNAWGSIDVLDTHYYAPNAWALLRPAADSRGYTNMAIWQTEVGNTSSNAFVANEFTRSFVWSLNNNWNSPNKYKWFFFTHYSTDGKSLMIPGKNLTSNGYQMQELGTLLGSNVFSAYSGITSSLSGLNQASLARASTSLEAVADGHQIVAFVHLSPFDYNANSSVTLTFPISNNRVISAQRVDLMGNNVILTTAGTSTTSVLVGTHDASGSSSFAWNSKQLSQGYAATFYVLLAIVSAAPTGVTDTAVSASQINVGWSASSGATSYNVKRATVSGGPYSTIANVTTESYSDTGLPSGTTYHYVISAMNASGESGNSAQVSATTFPAAPTGVTDTAVSASQINVGWSASSGATSYNVKRATVSGGPYTTVATLTNTTYNNTGLSSDTTYHYVVSALNASGESGDSAQVSATTFPPALLSQGRPTSASSFQTGNIVSNGNDGSLATRWAAVDSSYPQWWRVDLGATHNLSQVVINWYNSSSRSYKYKIEVSDDDATYSTVVNQTTRTASGDSTDNFSAVGRYLRVTVTGANAGWAGFYECKVYGE